jgi:UDPglucose--hexose-1-phosphate uridylyltransferase
VAITRTSTRLADGRELLYYDERPRADRPVSDPRELPPTSTSSELRHDPLRDEWVVVASHRQGRTFLPPAEQCPLCPSRPGRPTEIPAADYDVVVFENRFPSLVEDAGGTADAGAGLFATRPGRGRCEVVCFTPDHDASFATLPPSRVETVLEAWADRTRELAAIPGVEQVFVFENRGEEIGVTLSHPHGQIYAYPFVPPRTLRTLRSSRRHRQRTGGCLLCDLQAAERAAGTRVLAATDRWTAHVPHAARWPFELQLTPSRHLPDLPALDGDERAELAGLYPELLRRLDAVFGVKMPYVAAWQQAPVRADRELAHLYLEVFSVRRAPGKLKYLAGSESAAAVWINDVPPERAAELLRRAT